MGFKNIKIQVNELLNEVDAYNNHYYDQNFYPEFIVNDKNGIKRYILCFL